MLPGEVTGAEWDQSFSLDEIYKFQTPTAKTIPALSNNLKFFLSAARAFLPLSAASLIINDKFSSSKNCTNSELSSSSLSLSPSFPVRFVAERNFNFCLARNLIWPLESPNIFTQSGWLVRFSPNHISKQHQKLKKTRESLSLRNPQRERTSIRLFLNSSSSINHYEESHLVYGPPKVYSSRPRDPS